jgi:hypothetical protein
MTEKETEGMGSLASLGMTKKINGMTEKGNKKESKGQKDTKD